MAVISVLDPKTIDQIAAGEVVERPASVVKELTENAIDAGAGAISIEIRGGGASLIRVTDDGCGIAPEDIPKAFLPHATSKLKTIRDLDDLTTLGFRGEALSSIASVSRVEMITKTEEELTATRCLVEGGRFLSSEEIGAPDGTTVIVRDLFYNVPARAKFLKTPMTEASAIAAFVEQLALSHPAIAFSFRVGSQTRLETSGSGSLRDVIYRLYGREITGELVPIDYRDETGQMTVTGFIARPVISRGSRHFENYYVNGRYVKNHVIRKAIEDGYGTRLMNHQYPFTCLFITVDGRDVDVNVHPTKMEVRFSGETVIYERLRNLVAEALSGQEMIVRAKADNGRRPVPPVQAAAGESPAPAAEIPCTPSVSETPNIAAAQPVPPISREASPMVFTDISEAKPAVVREKPPVKESFQPFEKKGREAALAQTGKAESHDVTEAVCEQLSFGFLTENGRKTSRIIGQCFDTYWLVEYDGSLFIIDQHAAHEKVLYEELMVRYRDRNLASQTLSPPLIVTMTVSEEARFREHHEAFEALGFVIEPFGGRDYAVRGVPYTLEALGSRELFAEMLDHIDESDRLEDSERFMHRVATEACKAAVKAHDRLSISEASRLIDRLMTLEDPYHCPHGRPTIIAFTQKELEKKFKRIL